MDVVNGIDWDSLNLPEYEDAEAMRDRLEALHMEMLAKQGITLTPGKNSPGFAPSAAQAREVAVMACLGLEAKDIALVLNIELKLLKLYYEKELVVSANLANAMVARVALRMAMSGTSSDMTKFWLKTRAKWKETQAVELTGRDGGALELDSAKDRMRRAIEQQAAAGITGIAPAKQN